MSRVPIDATGKDSEQRFREIRRYFFELLAVAGNTRTELYWRPKAGDVREPTEEELVRRWADELRVSVNDIQIGMARGFLTAGEQRPPHVVRSFRYLQPHIVARIAELREARAGMQPDPFADAKVKPEILERERQRQERRQS